MTVWITFEPLHEKTPCPPKLDINLMEIIHLRYRTVIETSQPSVPKSWSFWQQSTTVRPCMQAFIDSMLKPYVTPEHEPWYLIESGKVYHHGCRSWLYSEIPFAIKLKRSWNPGPYVMIPFVACKGNIFKKGNWGPLITSASILIKINYETWPKRIVSNWVRSSLWNPDHRKTNRCWMF